MKELRVTEDREKMMRNTKKLQKLALMQVICLAIVSNLDYIFREPPHNRDQVLQKSMLAGLHDWHIKKQKQFLEEFKTVDGSLQKQEPATPFDSEVLMTTPNTFSSEHHRYLSLSHTPSHAGQNNSILSISPSKSRPDYTNPDDLSMLDHSSIQLPYLDHLSLSPSDDIASSVDPSVVSDLPSRIKALLSQVDHLRAVEHK